MANEGMNYLLAFLPYAGREPYPTRHCYGRMEELFATREEAAKRLRQLIAEQRIEDAQLYERAKGYVLGRKLIDEWSDEIVEEA